MQLSLNADVSFEVIYEAFRVMNFAILHDRPLNDLEALGWLVLSHNLETVQPALLKMNAQWEPIKTGVKRDEKVSS